MKQALTEALADYAKGRPISWADELAAAARLVERLLPGVCRTCAGSGKVHVTRVDGLPADTWWDCHMCHGSGRVWDEGIVEAVARAIYEFQRDDEEAGHSFHGGDWVRTMSQTPMHKETYRRQARAGLSAIAQLVEKGET